MKTTRNQWYKSDEWGNNLPPCPKFNRLLDRLKTHFTQYEDICFLNAQRLERGIEPNYEKQDRHADMVVKLYNRAFNENVSEPYDIPPLLIQQLA